MRHLTLAASCLILGWSSTVLAGTTDPKEPEYPEQRSTAPAPATCTPNKARGQTRPNQGGKIVWRRDLEAALAEAARTQRRLLIYFTADW